MISQYQPEALARERRWRLCATQIIGRKKDAEPASELFIAQRCRPEEIVPPDFVSLRGIESGVVIVGAGRLRYIRARASNQNAPFSSPSKWQICGGRYVAWARAPVRGSPAVASHHRIGRCGANVRARSRSSPRRRMPLRPKSLTWNGGFLTRFLTNEKSTLDSSNLSSLSIAPRLRRAPRLWPGTRRANYRLRARLS